MQVTPPATYVAYASVDPTTQRWPWRMSRARRAVAFRRVAAWRAQRGFPTWPCDAAAEALAQGEDAFVARDCISAWPVLKYYVEDARWYEVKAASWRRGALTSQECHAVTATVRGYLLQQRPLTLSTLRRAMLVGGSCAQMAIEMLGWPQP